MAPPTFHLGKRPALRSDLGLGKRPVGASSLRRSQTPHFALHPAPEKSTPHPLRSATTRSRGNRGTNRCTPGSPATFRRHRFQIVGQVLGGDIGGPGVGRHMGGPDSASSRYRKGPARLPRLGLREVAASCCRFGQFMLAGQRRALDPRALGRAATEAERVVSRA